MTAGSGSELVLGQSTCEHLPHAARSPRRRMKEDGKGRQRNAGR